MSIVRRTSVALIASLVLLAGCGRGATYAEPDDAGPRRTEEVDPEEPGTGGGPTILEVIPQGGDSTENIPHDTTGRGGGMHGSGG
ncbi:MAG TPA: hypothetical protein VF625_06615 [Longimicrobium sp.]